MKVFIWKVILKWMDFLYILSIRPASSWTRTNCKIMKNKDCIPPCQFAEVVLRRNSMTRYDKDLCGPVHHFSSTPIRLVWVKALSFSEQVLVEGSEVVSRHICKGIVIIPFLGNSPKAGLWRGSSWCGALLFLGHFADLSLRLANGLQS